MDLENAKDTQIFAKIMIGSQKQPFNMLFDTGSNWLWIFSSECYNCPNVDKFDSYWSYSYKSQK